MSHSLQPHGLQHASLLSLPLSPGVRLNSCPRSPWCYLTTSYSVAPFSSCSQSSPASGSFLMSRLFASGGQSIRDSALPTVLPVNIQGWFPLGLTNLISFLSKGLSKVLSSITFFFCSSCSLYNRHRLDNFG